MKEHWLHYKKCFIKFRCNIGLSIQLLGTYCRLSTLYFAPQLFGCVFEINFNNKLCALLSYSATRHGIVEKSSRNVKAEYIVCRPVGAGVAQILADQLTLSQSGVLIMPITLLLVPLDF